MTKEQFEEVKTSYIESITGYMKDETGMQPHISIFAEKLDEGEDSTPCILHMPIPGKIMNSDDDKDKLVNVVLPRVAKEVKKDFKPYGLAWTSEAWVRKADKNMNDNAILDNWKEIPISKEILMINIESHFGNEIIVYEIKRKGMEITEDGLKDTVELILDEELSVDAKGMTGRFTGLYNKFIKTHD